MKKPLNCPQCQTRIGDFTDAGFELNQMRNLSKVEVTPSAALCKCRGCNNWLAVDRNGVQVNYAKRAAEHLHVKK